MKGKIPKFFQFRRTRSVNELAEKIMRRRRFFSYSEMFRTLLREESERLGD